jgi:hypothetical protein
MSFGLKTTSLFPYHLAIIQKLGCKKYQDNPDKFAELKADIDRLSAGSWHITHTCGNGRKTDQPDSQICCNPHHLKIREKAYNEEQKHTVIISSIALKQIAKVLIILACVNMSQVVFKKINNISIVCRLYLKPEPQAL